MNPRFGLAVTGTVAAVALVLGGCSSSGGSGGGTSSPQGGVSASGAAAGGSSLASLVPANIKSDGTVNVATPGGTPPEEFTDPSGTLVGYEIDLIKAVTALLGLKPQFELTQFASIIPGMQANRYELAVGQFGIKPAREKVVDMVSIASLNEAFGVIKSSGITSLTQATLCGHSVAILSGSIEQNLASEQSQMCTSGGKRPVTIDVYPDNGSAWLAVLSGRAQVYWSGSTAARYTVQQSKAPAAVVGTDRTPSPTGILVQKGSGLAPAIQKAMQQLIDSGQYAAIMEKWGVAGAEIKTSQLNPVISGS